MKEEKVILRDYVTDMIGVEKHILEAVGRQLGDKRVRSYGEAFDLLARIEGVLRGHLHALEQHLSTLTLDTESAESMLKKAVTTVAGAAAGIYDRLRMEDAVSRNLRDDYTALNLASISYAMLHTTALGLRNMGTSDLALRHLHDLTPLVVDLSRVIPLVVVEELQKEGKVIDAVVKEEAVLNTQKAWSHGVVEEAAEEVMY